MFNNVDTINVHKTEIQHEFLTLKIIINPETQENLLGHPLSIKEREGNVVFVLNEET